MRTLLTLALWMIAWLLWSGLYKPLLITLGVISCLLVLVLTRRMEDAGQEYFNLRLTFKLVPFWAWLFGELVKANLQVARIILSPGLPISPTVVRIDALEKETGGQALLANSITLTPGTVTIDDHEAKLFVHCLTREGADEVREGEMNRRIAQLAAR